MHDTRHALHSIMCRFVLSFAQIGQQMWIMTSPNGKNSLRRPKLPRSCSALRRRRMWIMRRDTDPRYVPVCTCGFHRTGFIATSGVSRCIEIGVEVSSTEGIVLSRSGALCGARDVELPKTLCRIAHKSLMYVGSTCRR